MSFVARIYVGNDYAEWIYDDVDMEEFKGMTQEDIEDTIIDTVFDNIRVEFYESEE